ncbi:hypothetical protein BC628DRAFT_133946 [Trametes gibbosa]|nr:hypothetical protein BC628DRAFT_133946 [Trametes gibbosa]
MITTYQHSIPAGSPSPHLQMSEQLEATSSEDAEVEITRDYLSKRAQEQNADILVWWADCGPDIILFFNSVTTPITAETFRRWLKLMAPWAWDEEPIVTHAVLYHGVRKEVVSVRPACVFTGSAYSDNPDNNVDVYWIVPRSCKERLRKLSWENLYAMDFGTKDNVMPMRADIYELWISCKFTVDVEDHYRIYVFREDGVDAKATLPTHLHDADPAWDFFLKRHFL